MSFACPHCGAPVSERAAACPRCGVPVRGSGAAPGARSSAMGCLRLILVVVVGTFLGVVMIGVLAAIAIPYFAHSARQAREKEGALLLRRAYDLERSYRAEHGRYTSRLDELRWTTARSTPHYDLRVSAADGRNLCLEAAPGPTIGESTRPMSMDADGTIFHEAGCGGVPALLGAGGPGAAPGPDGATAAGRPGEVAAKGMLGQVYAGVAAYRARHGRTPANVDDVLEEAGDFRPGTEYQLDSAMHGGQVCFIARPRGRSSLMTYSLDPAGRMFEGPGCTGALVGRFSSGG